MQQITNICEALPQDSNAKAVLVIDNNGRAVGRAGDIQPLTTGNVASWAAPLRREPEHAIVAQVHEVENASVYISVIERRLILGVRFDEHSSLGLVRLRARQAQAELMTVPEVMFKSSASN